MRARAKTARVVGDFAGVYVVSILERRKATLAYLKQTASTSGDLEDYQVSELVEQMKVNHRF